MALEPVNLLQKKRRNTFKGDGTKVEFQTDAKDWDSAEVEIYVDGQLKIAGTDYTVDAEQGTITFTTAPETTSGNDNISIIFPGLCRAIGS